jgi:hypothetical protein
MPESDPLAEVLEALLDEHDEVERSGRTLRLPRPVNGDPGFAVLRILGVAQAAFPVGAAASGPAGVAIGVWRPPDLYLARWRPTRWVVGYRLARGSRPGDYVRSEGRIPGHYETGNWYTTIPDDVTEAFFDVGLSLEAPPFPLPEVPASPEPKGRSRRSPSTKAPAAPSPRRAAPPKPKPVPAPKPMPPTTRVCPACNMRRVLTQFTPGSDLCIDCR